MLTRVSQVFYNLCSSDNPPELQLVQTKMAGPLATHSSAIYMYPGLFARIDAVFQNRLSLGFMVYLSCIYYMVYKYLCLYGSICIYAYV